MPAEPLLLASASAIRLSLLHNAGVPATAHPARIDEDAIRAALQAEDASPRDMADALADLKARKIAGRHPAALVLGCDQVLALGAQVFAKPASPDDARSQLQRLRNHTHHLHSAIVLYHQGQPVWRHLASAKLTMRPFTDAFLDDYIPRNWPSIRHAVGAYLLESEGIRLFTAVEGDYFAILGLPMLPLLNYLTLRGFLTS
jgi:septum formation protein